MPFNYVQTLKVFEFDIFEEVPVNHAVYSRHGGVSSDPWYSLNLGSSVGDRPEDVAENHRLALSPYGFRKTDIFDVWLVHGDDIAIAEGPRMQSLPYQKADIILTDKPGLPLFMRYADCVPIFLFDTNKRVAGIVHSGWQGTVKQAVRKAVLGMEQYYGSSPGDIAAGIGPSIGPDHYEIGPEVVEQVQDSFGQQAEKFLPSLNGSVYLDLWRANEWLLEDSGVQMVENPRICTACNPQDWYSHRHEHGKTGRFGAFICIAN